MASQKESPSRSAARWSKRTPPSRAETLTRHPTWPWRSLPCRAGEYVLTHSSAPDHHCKAFLAMAHSASGAVAVAVLVHRPDPIGVARLLDLDDVAFGVLEEPGRDRF